MVIERSRHRGDSSITNYKLLSFLARILNQFDCVAVGVEEEADANLLEVRRRALDGDVLVEQFLICRIDVIDVQGDVVDCAGG